MVPPQEIVALSVGTLGLSIAASELGWFVLWRVLFFSWMSKLNALALLRSEFEIARATSVQTRLLCVSGALLLVGG